MTKKNQLKRFLAISFYVSAECFSFFGGLFFISLAVTIPFLVFFFRSQYGDLFSFLALPSAIICAFVGRNLLKA